VVELVVLDPGLGVVAAGPHLLVGHRRERHLVAGVADGGDVALVDVDEVPVHPAVGLLGGLVVEDLLVGAAAHVAHTGDAPALDAGAPVPVAGGQPGLPHVGRLDDVVVDADDLGDHDRI
jgi:hypothetical protein